MTNSTADKATQKKKIGRVTSDKRSKTRRVEIQFLTKHSKYGKFMRKTSVLHVHDEANDSKRGDTVEIEECRPISKTKSWRIVRVVERGGVEFTPTEVTV